MSQPTLFLMLGYPGAGKTTTAEIVAQQTGAVHLSSDKIRLHMFKEPQFTPAEHSAVYGTIDYFTELLLASGISVIYDANLNRFMHRQQKYDICARTQAQAIVLWIQTPKQTARQRATELAHTDPHRRVFGNFAPEVFDRIATGIEKPKPEERVITMDGTKITPESVKQALATIEA